MAEIRYFAKPVKVPAWLPGQEPWRLGLRRALRLYRERQQREAEEKERAEREERERPHRELRKKIQLVPSALRESWRGFCFRPSDERGVFKPLDTREP
jgi:hypothetical protein